MKDKQTNIMHAGANASWRMLLMSLLCLFMALPMSAQLRAVSGTVFDHEGEPVIGATVQVVGTNRATATDIDGQFTLQASPKDKIQVSYIGYKPMVQSAAQTKLTFNLEQDSQVLEDVVVVGYGTQKKATLTGAVSAISNKEITVTKNENVINMLSGKIPGVRISQTSSSPGSNNNKIDIRGMGSPLIVVDGIPRDQDYFSRMDANEIDNISVLKDASAAIYGVQAANGVILVTTKHGSGDNGKFNVTASANWGWQQFLYVPETSNTQTHMLLMNEKRYNNSFNANYMTKQTPEYTYDQMYEYSSGKKKSTNWSKELFRDWAPQQQYNVSLDGGTEKIKYFFNIGYLKQESSYRSGSLNYDRWNFRSNVDAQISRDFSVNVQLSGYMGEKNEPATDTWTTYKYAWTLRPNAEPWLDGDHNRPAFSDELGSDNNPVATTNSKFTGYSKERTYNFNGAMTIQYNVPWVKGLNAKAFYSYDYYTTDNEKYVRAYNLYGYNAAGELQVYNKNTDPKFTRSTNPAYGTLLNLSINYANDFGEHHVSAMALFEESYRFQDNFYAMRKMLLDGRYIFLGESEGQEGTAYENGIWDRTRRAWLGRVNYDFRGTYMVDFAFRYDASSGFPKDSRWGFFPSVSAGWRFSQEKFIQKYVGDWLSNGKLRFSWGKMGDDNGRNYPSTMVGYEPNTRRLGWIYGGSIVSAVLPTAVPNPNLTWYTATTINGGIDLGFFNQRLTATAELFRRNRDGLFATSSAIVPGHVGASLPAENIEKDQTFGWEINAMWNDNVAGVHYYVSAQIGATKNRWRYKLNSRSQNSMEQWRNTSQSGRNKDQWWSVEEGGRFNSIEDIRWHPIAQTGCTTLPGDYYYKDWNGDGQINGKDSHPIATRNLPVFNYGITMGADWKGIDISLNWQGAAKVYGQYGEVFTEVGPFNGGAALDMYEDRWRPKEVGADPWNPYTEWIKGEFPATGHSFNSWQTGIRNTSYLRLKTLEVGYSLPVNWLKVVGASSLRVYFNAYNLLTFTGLKHMDPERPGTGGGAADAGGNNGVLFYNYPINRTFNVGATLKF